MADFKVGMRVKALHDHMGRSIKGLIGTVRSCNGSVGVEFDANMHGHDLGGLCEKGYGWYVPCNILEVIEDKKEPKYKIGDKVIVATSNIDGRLKKCKYENEIGTIVSIDDSYEYPYAVDGTSYGGTLYVTVKGLAEEKKEERKLGEFRPGDRVMTRCTVGRAEMKNQIGTVIGSWNGDYLIEFDNDINGHNGFGNRDADGNILKCKHKHGWYVNPLKLDLIKEGEGEPRFDWTIETDVYTQKPIEVVVLSFSYPELAQLRFAHRQGFVFAAKMNNELWFFKEDPRYPSAFRIEGVI